jgi:hypothetical protein
MLLLPGGGSATDVLAPVASLPTKAAKNAQKLLSPDLPGLTVPPPPPTREDSAISAARKKQQQAELMRRGRRATILTKGIEDGLGNVSRPEARSANLFGE